MRRARASVERKAKRREMEQRKKSLTPRVPQGTRGRMGGWRDKNGVAQERAKKPVVRVNDSFYEDKRLGDKCLEGGRWSPSPC